MSEAFNYQPTEHGQERLADVIPLYPSEPGPEDELLWAMDFKDGVVATKVMYRGVKTYGHLASQSKESLSTSGLSEQEIGVVKALLDSRGLGLLEIDPVE